MEITHEMEKQELGETREEGRLKEAQVWGSVLYFSKRPLFWISTIYCGPYSIYLHIAPRLDFHVAVFTD
jgi:hypothetical protein